MGSSNRTIKLQKRLFNQKSLVAKKLKFITGESSAALIPSSPKSAKLMRLKTISKKPPTKFQEFRLSHQKPKSRGRRAMVEDLLSQKKDDVSRRLFCAK